MEQQTKPPMDGAREEGEVGHPADPAPAPMPPEGAEQAEDMAREQALLRQKEEALDRRERQLNAQEVLRQRQWPIEAIPLLDVGSADGLQRSLAHLEKLLQAVQKGGAPRVAPPVDNTKNLSYKERAARHLGSTY